MIVLRRTTPRHDGTRYYAKPAPVQSHVEHARKFATMADAEAERAGLREPWLWEALDEADAARLDAQEAKALWERMANDRKGDIRRNPVFRNLLAIAAVSDGFALPPEMRR